MVTEAKFKLRIDTAKAKEDLRQIAKDGEAVTGRVNRRMRERASGTQAQGGRGAAFGLGAVAGAAVGVGRRVSAGGVGDVFGEVFAGVTADVDAAVGGPEARAKKIAREQIKQQFSNIVGREGITPDIRGQYQTLMEQARIEQQGASQIERVLTGGTEGSIKEGVEVVDKLIDAVVGAIKDGFSEIISRSFGFGGK